MIFNKCLVIDKVYIIANFFNCFQKFEEKYFVEVNKTVPLGHRGQRVLDEGFHYLRLSTNLNAMGVCSGWFIYGGIERILLLGFCVLRRMRTMG